MQDQKEKTYEDFIVSMNAWWETIPHRLGMKLIPLNQTAHDMLVEALDNATNEYLNKE